MSDQKLNNRELLNVRWAFDDPNPKARKEVNLFPVPVSVFFIELFMINFIQLKYLELTRNIRVFPVLTKTKKHT